MAIPLGRRTVAICAVAIALAAAIGYWAYGAHQKRAFDGAVIALLDETASRLEEGLEAGSAGELAQFEARAQAADASLQALRRLDARANRALGDAADEYLLSARETLRRQAERRRLQLALAESAQALRRHMRSDNRTGAWVEQAVNAKERVNRDYRGYRLSTEALDALLRDLPASQRKIAPWIEARRLLTEERLTKARERIKRESTAATAEFGQLERLRAGR